MKISNQTKINNVNFCSIPLYKANLIKKNLFWKKTSLSALVSFVDKTDLNRASMQYSKWMLTEYGEELLNLLHHKHANFNHFLMVEVPSAKVGNQVKALAFFGFDRDAIELKLLQSQSQKEFFRKTKGTGSLLLYALSKIVEICGKKEIIVYPDTKALYFYKKLGFKQTGYKVFSLCKENFGKMQKAIEERFHTTPA